MIRPSRSNWFLGQVERGTVSGKAELENLHEGTSKSKGVNTEPNDRSERSAPLAALVVGAIRLLAGVILLGNNEVVARKTCLAHVDRKRKKTLKINLTFVAFVQTPTKFFVWSQKNQKRFGKHKMKYFDVHNQKWATIEEQFEKFPNKIHFLRNCDKVLFSRQQIYFDYDSVSFLVAFRFSKIKLFRWVLTAYQMNLMSAIPTLLTRRLPMSLALKNLQPKY